MSFSPSTFDNKQFKLSQKNQNDFQNQSIKELLGKKKDAFPQGKLINLTQRYPGGNSESINSILKRRNHFEQEVEQNINGLDLPALRNLKLLQRNTQKANTQRLDYGMRESSQDYNSNFNAAFGSPVNKDDVKNATDQSQNKINFSKFNRKKPSVVLNEKQISQMRESQDTSNMKDVLGQSKEFQIGFVKNKDVFNKTSEKQIIDKQRGMIHSLISSGRQNHAALFKYDFYDGNKCVFNFIETKLLEVEKILKKKLRKNSQPAPHKTSTKKNSPLNSARNNSQIIKEQNPQLIIDRMVIKNLQIQQEQEMYNVLRNEQPPYIKNAKVSRTTQQSVVLNTDISAAGTKIPSLDMKNWMPSYLKEKPKKVLKIKGDSRDFQNKVDSVILDEAFLKGAKDIQQQHNRSPSQVGIYQKDFEIKLAKMEKNLDKHLSTIGESIDTAEQQLANEQKRMNNIIYKQGKKSPQPAKLSQSVMKKEKPKDHIHKAYNNNHASNVQVQPPELLVSNIDQSFIDQIGSQQIETPLDSYNNANVNLNYQEMIHGNRLIRSPLDEQQSQSDYYQQLFAQTQNTLRSPKIKWKDDENYFNQQIQELQETNPFVANLMKMNDIKQQSKNLFQEQEFQKIVGILLEMNDRENDMNKSMTENFNKTLSHAFDDYACNYETELINIERKDVTFARIAREIQDKTTFNKLCKNYISPKIVEQYEMDSGMSYFQMCQKELVLVLPILQKIKNRTLNLTGYLINSGLSKALNISLKNLENIISRVVFDNNSLKDEEFSLILEGFTNLLDLKSIIYRNNEFGNRSLDNLKNILIKPLPNNLEELRIYNCKISPTISQSLLECLLQRSYLRKLGLVKAGINDGCIQKVIELLQRSRYLIDLDLSWNELRPQSIKQLLDVIGENRQLQYFNISWNNMIEKSGQTQNEQAKSSIESTQKNSIIQLISKNLKGKGVGVDIQTQIMFQITRFIKYNKNLLHLDISNCGLNEGMLWQIGNALRRSKSMIALHLSGNPGVTQDLKDYLFSRARCKPKQKHNTVQFENLVKISLSKNSPKKELIQEGVQLRQVLQQKKFNVNASQQYNADQEDKKLIFTRIIGHREEMPGSGQWQMLTDSYDNCWVCDQWVYSLVFWSTTIGYKSQIELDVLERDQILDQIKIINEEQMQQSSDAPLICGSFNNWIQAKMMRIQDFCALISKEKPDYLKLMKERKMIRNAVESLEDCSNTEKERYVQFIIDYQNSMRDQWKEILSKNLKYRKTFLANVQCIDQVPKDEELYVYPVFMKAGKHSFFVQNEYESFFHKFLSPYREEEIPINVKLSKFKVTTRVFKKDASVFKDWKEDTPQSLLKCGESDQKFWKVPRFVKDPLEQEKCWQIVQDNIIRLKNIFISQASRSMFPNISWIDFTVFCESCKIIDKNVVLATIDRLFIATNVELEQISENPDKALCRYEFFEILVRIANAKFKEPGLVSSHSESFKKLLYENIFPNAREYPWQEFRDEELWTMDVNDVFEANLEGLKKVYGHYWEPRKKFMTMHDAMSLFMKDTNVGLIEKDAIFCYGMCKMTVVNESEEASVKYKRLQFVELLEMIGRVADLKFKNTEMDKLSLAKKIEYILDDVLALVEVRRKDVNIVVDDQSESDDDY